MDDNLSWVFQNKDVQQPRLCSQCGEILHVSWHGERYDYGCENYACTLFYVGPPYTEAELSSDREVVLGPPNCPRCLVPMQIVSEGRTWQFSCQQDGCDGIWPPRTP